MRILITGSTGDSMPPPYGGIPKVSLLYGRAWKKMGNEVVITFVYRPKNADDFNANCKYFFEYGSKPNKLKKFLFLAKYFIKNPVLYFSLLFSYLKIYPKLQIETILYSAYGIFMDKVIKDFNPDIILSQTALIKTHMVLEIAKKRKIPVVIDSYAEIRDQNMGVNKYLNDFDQRKYWVNFLERAELVLGISNCTDGAKKYLPSSKVKEFYDTCDFTLSNSDVGESCNQLRQRFNIPKDIFIIGAIGAFEYRKGHDHLIRVVSILNKSGKNVGAIICGGSGDKTKWEILAKEEGVENKIFLFQNFSGLDLIRLHRIMDVYCNLSNSPRSCGLDLALLEAMASGLPIVVSNNGSLPTAVNNNKNGYIVKTDDIEDASNAFLNIYNKSEEERRIMGEESKKLAEKCDINLTAEVKINWFRDIVKNYKK